MICLILSKIYEFIQKKCYFLSFYLPFIGWQIIRNKIVWKGLKLRLFLGGELFIRTVLDIYDREWDEDEEEWVKASDNVRQDQESGNWRRQGPGV